MPEDDPPPVEVDHAVERVLSALLRLAPADASRIRERTSSRRRPRPQSGPTADYR